MKLRISLAQMDIALGEPDTNLEVVRVLATEAARRGTDLLVLPELWSTGYDLARAGEHATSVEAGVFAEMGALAKRHNLHVVGSCLARLNEEGEEPAVGNTATWFNRDGKLEAVYSKLHLFRLMDEERYLVGGDGPVVVTTPWGKVGLAICYDLRFPELFRTYALAGAGMVVLPAEWPHPRLRHWRTLIRARAIENQSYLIACNRVGRSGDDEFCGHSCIVDPWGETVIEGGESAQLLTAEIDVERVSEVRERIPVFSDRRPDAYNL